ncbi:hypothetical protein MPER_07940 [Moniliophthora perniciosa FA553]|nr:hypothetical protein MPER_07940 [Moniliophthora perniciosa FA553]
MVLQNIQCRYLHDSTTGRAIYDSLAIASYLDEAYPVTPVVIPSGTRVLQSLVADSFATNFNGLLAILRPRINQYMTPSFLEEIKKAYGEAVVSAEPTADEVKDGWVKAKKSFDELDKFFGEADEPYVMGNRPSYADFSLAAFLLPVRVYCGEDSHEWREVKGWASGRVGRICDGVFTIKA